MAKLVRLTDLSGQVIYIGAGWVIKPSLPGEDGGARIEHSGTYQAVRESVEEVAKLLEATLIEAR